MWVRDRLDGLWRDEDFADWYPRDGRPGLLPAQLATVCVLQFLLGLSDRQAAEAVRCRIDFKYALVRLVAHGAVHDPQPVRGIGGPGSRLKARRGRSRWMTRHTVAGETANSGASCRTVRFGAVVDGHQQHSIGKRQAPRPPAARTFAAPLPHHP
jgi:hypothetical protein